MKLIIYDPHQVGYVSLNPYEWEYNGRYPKVESFLERNIQPTESQSYETDDGKIVEVKKEIEDEEQILRRISFNLNNYGFLTEIIEE